MINGQFFIQFHYHSSTTTSHTSEKNQTMKRSTAAAASRSPALSPGLTAYRGTPKSSKQSAGVVLRERANEQASSKRIKSSRPGQAFGSEATQKDVPSSALCRRYGWLYEQSQSDLADSRDVIAELRSKLDQYRQAAGIGHLPSCIQDLISSTARPSLRDQIDSLSFGLYHLIVGSDIYVWKKSSAANEELVATRNCLKLTHPQNMEDASGLYVAVISFSTDNTHRVIAASPQGDIRLWVVNARVLCGDPALSNELITVKNCDAALSLSDRLQDNEVITSLLNRGELVLAYTSKGRLYKIEITADPLNMKARTFELVEDVAECPIQSPTSNGSPTFDLNEEEADFNAVGGSDEARSDDHDSVSNEGLSYKLMDGRSIGYLGDNFIDATKVEVAKDVAKLENMVDRFRSRPGLYASNANALVILLRHLIDCFSQGADFDRLLEIARLYLKLYLTLSKMEKYKSIKQKAVVVCIDPQSTFGGVAESAERANAAAEQAESPEIKAFLTASEEALSSIPKDDDYPDFTVSKAKSFDRSTRNAIGNLSHLCLAIETFRRLTLYDVFSRLQDDSESLNLLRKAAELAVAICPSMDYLDLQDDEEIEIWAEETSTLSYSAECLCPALMSDTHRTLACEVACDLRKYTTETKGNDRYKEISKAFREAQKVTLGGGKRSSANDYCAGKGGKFTKNRSTITQMFYDLIMMRSIASILPRKLFPSASDFIAYKLFGPPSKINAKCLFNHDFFSGEMSETKKEELVKDIRGEIEHQMEHLQKMEGRRVILIENDTQVAAIEEFIRFEA